MGCGLYDLLGWGVLHPPFRVDKDGYEIDVEWISGIPLHTSSEAEPCYLVVPLAVGHPVLQDWWKLPPLPLWVPRSAARTAQIIIAPPDVAVPGAVQTQWATVQGWYAKAGMVLPPATYVLVNDWD